MDSINYEGKYMDRPSSKNEMKLSTTLGDSVIMKRGLSMNVIIMFKIQGF